MSQAGVRVRFAPSPTGHLHVGGARTAIYNWLFARHAGGTFVLRIDDTDPERSLPEYTEAILRALRWLGLDWDEGPTDDGGSIGEHGPYFQSRKMQRYRDAAGQLLDTMNAYRCYCPPEDLERQREQARAEKRPQAYDRRCRTVSEETRLAHERAGTPFAVRFAVHLDGETAYDDAVRGRLSVENAHIDDFVILRSDGTPTYNFATVLDDADMGITHVIRGDDHISNTPKQILIFEALGAPVPTFAHLPMIWGPDKKRLSKRHGAASVEAFADEGYLPEAVLNFLALLGWSSGTEETLFRSEELVRLFTLDRVSDSPAIFDLEKLAWMDGEYIRSLADAALVQRARPFLEAAGLVEPLGLADADDASRDEWWGLLAAVTKERIRTLAELPEVVRFLFEDLEPDETARAKALSAPDVGDLLRAAADTLGELPSFEPSPIEEALRALAERLGVKPKALFQALRAAVTGRLVSPPLFESMALLGRDPTLARIARAAG